MCIGIPMQVESATPGIALCRSRGALQRVRTALVGDVEPGEWLLVFLDSAQERIDVQRAAEIEATLALLAAVQQPGTAASELPAEAAFALPSRMSRDELLALSRGF